MKGYSEFLFIGGQLVILLYWNIHAHKHEKKIWRKKGLVHLACVTLLLSGLVYLTVKIQFANTPESIDHSFTLSSFFIVTGFIFSLVASLYYYLNHTDLTNKFYTCFKLIEIATLSVFLGCLMKSMNWRISFSTFFLLLFHAYLIAFFLRLKF